MTSETVLGIDPGAHRAVTPYLNVRGSRCCVFAHQSIPLMSMFETTPIESAIRSGVILRRDLHAAGKAQVFCNSAAAAGHHAGRPIRHPGARRRPPGRHRLSEWRLQLVRWYGAVRCR